MAKAVLKTKKTAASVDTFLAGIPDPDQRLDALAIAAIMQQATKTKPKMWGRAVVGFGNVHLKYESGRELDWFAIGFSPRKQNLTLYLIPGVERYAPLLKKLGKHTVGKGCLYIKRLEDVDPTTLKELIQRAAVEGAKPPK